MKINLLKGNLVHERYIVEELLGQGGFGAVYRVRDRRAKSNVFALKEVTNPNKHQQANFLFEGDILRRLDHPALPRVYRVFEDGENNLISMLMDYVEGPNLEQLRLQQPAKRFSFPQALKIMRPIMEAVSYLHAQQPPIIHRDIKPANVIVSPLDEGAMLVDFGIAKEYDENSTTAAIRHCSPGYGAPEQYVSGTSMQTDIYGLGATFYTLLTGEVPIDALYRITRLSGKKADPLVPANELVPSIPAAIADVLQCAMAVNSSDRLATVQEFWEALQAHADPASDNQALCGKCSSTPEIAGKLYPSSVASTVLEMPSSASGKVWQGPHPQRTMTRHKHVRSLLVGLVVLILIAVSSGVAMGSLSLWSGAKHAKPLQVIALTSQKSQTPAPPALSQMQTQDTSPSSSAATAHDLRVALSYQGTVHNTVRNMDATLSLSQIKQNSSYISGYYTIEANFVSSSSYSIQSDFIDSGYFTGEVTTDNKIRFFILSSDGLWPLLFKGQFQSDGSISGSYSSYLNNHNDASSGEYGSWNVAPQAAHRQEFTLPGN